MKQNNSYDSQGKLLPRSEPLNLPGNFPEIFPEILPERYQLGSVLGEGGMGKVYKAYDSFLDQTVSIKFLKNSGNLEKSALRFQKEAKTASTLNHSNIATVLDFGILSDSTLYMVSNYIDAVDLKERIKEKGPLTILEALTVLEQIADCLAYIHEKGILHRDIKSSNILIKEEGQDGIQAYLLDFGIAKFEKIEGAEDTEDIEDGNLTLPGGVLGSPQYLSPEQAAGLPLDERSDIYSLAVVAYEIISGRLPFHGDTAFDTINKHINEEAPPLDSLSNRADLPAALSTLVERMMVKDPSARVQSMKEVASTCATIKEGILEQQKRTQNQQPLFAEELEIHLTPMKEDPDRAKNRKFLYLAAGLILAAGLTGLAALTLQETRKKEISAAVQKHEVKIDNSKLTEFDENFKDAMVAEAMIRKESYRKEIGPISLDNYKAIPGSDGRCPDWSSLAKAKSDFYLILEEIDLKEGDFEEILKAPRLKGLSINTTGNFGDRSMELLSHRKDLISLRLSHQKSISAAGYKQLKNIDALKSLEVNHAGLDRDKVAAICTADKLTTVKLRNNPALDDEDMALILERMPNLESLSLEGCSINGRTLDQTGKAQKLTTLYLNENPIDDRGLARLAKSGSNLAFLELSDTQITGKGLKSLARLKHLEELSIGNCPKLPDFEIDNLSHGLKFKITQYQTRDKLESFLSF